jgi:formamidopyrimidine-DNA glycosylase
MPELPEVETVRRMLETAVMGRTIATVALSGLRLRERVDPALPRRLRGRTITGVDRTGKFLLVRLDGELVLLSHLGMTGRWLVLPPGDRSRPGRHVHARVRFEDGTRIWFEDPRRFGLIRLVAAAALSADPALRQLGPDPIASPPTGPRLAEAARGSRTAVKTFLMDQRRVAGIGNIYASEVLHRSRVDPRRPAGRLAAAEWALVAAEIRAVLAEAIEKMGTTFSDYRTPAGEPGAYAAMLRVYDRAGEPCRECGQPIRRIVQGQRSTYFCPSCQRRSRTPAGVPAPADAVVPRGGRRSPGSARARKPGGNSHRLGRRP